MSRHPRRQPSANPEGVQQIMGVELHPRWTSKNPAVQKWGLGPAGETCKNCEHLFANGLRSGKRFLKCAKRGEVEGISCGPRTDHRAGWEACKKFEPEQIEKTAPAGSRQSQGG